MGLKEWWNRVNGNTNEPEETGLSDAAVAQNVVGGGEMEIIVRQHEEVQIVRAFHQAAGAAQLARGQLRLVRGRGHEV